MTSRPRSRAPRSATHAIEALADSLAPQTPLARVQRVWSEAAGEVIAQQSAPTSERAGVVTVTCSSAVWAQELDLLGADLIARLNEALGAPVVVALRCQAAQARKWPERPA